MIRLPTEESRWDVALSQQAASVALCTCTVSLVQMFFVTANSLGSKAARFSSAFRTCACVSVWFAVAPRVVYQTLVANKLFEFSDHETLQCITFATAVLLFGLMQATTVRSKTVLYWGWIDQLCYHTLMLDSLFAKSEQGAAPFAALILMAILQTVIPSAVVSALGQLAVLFICGASSTTFIFTGGAYNADRFFCAMMLFFFTCTIPTYRMNRQHTSQQSRQRSDSLDSRRLKRNCAQSVVAILRVSSVVAASIFGIYIAYLGAWTAPLVALSCACIASCLFVRVLLLSD